jgi:hypothetical protein
MRRFKMLVFSQPFPGREDEFNEWYTGQHLADICALPGFTSAQRFTLHSVSMGTTLNPYLAIYDVETDDPDWVIETMFAARDTPAMPISPAFDLDATTLMLFEEATGVVYSRNKG